MIEGRETYVVDLQRKTKSFAVTRLGEPIYGTYSARIWVDCERAVPLRIEQYDKYPDSAEARLTCRIDSIELHQLPNSGWFPVKGTRTLYFGNGSVISEHVAVDVTSITIQRKGIPESLFKLEFPEGTRVYNGFLVKLKSVGKALLEYAGQNDSKFPDTLDQIEPYDTDGVLGWAKAHVTYVGKGMTSTERPANTAIAYDHVLLEESGNSNVLYRDGRVFFFDQDQLKRFNISFGQKTAGQVVVEGIRPNRAKFECGYLAWSSKQITARFANSGRPATELAGQYELWWDGKKMATRYLRDQFYTGPKGSGVEKQQGGNSYDGGVLSRKPDFRDDNWLGPHFTRWRGLGSQDWLIRQDSEHESIGKDWSVVDNNGVKLIRAITKNTNETDRDYGGYSIRDYDPSKGYGLVNEEWYNPNGSQRLKHTVKMLEVIPGGWFPVEVDFKSFAITDGKVYSHNHCALDVGRCSFNDRAALPDRIFKSAEDKQIKYQEKVQKYLAMELEGISDVKEAAKADRVKRGAREAIEKFVGAAMAGDFEKAGKFAHPDKLPADHIKDVYEATNGQNLWIMAVVADDSSAIAVSSVILGDHDRTGPLVFFLDRKPEDGRDNWWVHDIDMETPDGAEVELKQFFDSLVM